MTESLRGNTDMTGRRAPFAAVLALTDQLGVEWGILPCGPVPIEVWVSLFCSETSGAVAADDRPRMALDIVRGYVAARHDQLWRQETVSPSSSSYGWEREVRSPYGGWIGRVTHRGEVALIPEVVAKVLAEHGYSLDAVVASWAAEGVVMTREGERPPHSIPQRIGPTRTRCLVFARDAVDVTGRVGDED
ncbi:hypothetical protein LKL35_33370 [Streptomyces sp. ET3-23]|uniref:hypothetical protein n=1 Tax=Streptomyces sp. ET3-23 TaxID=2885643 RepID=UPI001D0FF1A6|nr:hypothetical protein [Streptomyces sp. ET3-23]MCC2280273.1 hypothetical protein [Streptomyces sp. ET3-23]